MKFTMEVTESDLITVDEIVKKLGLEKLCQKQCEEGIITSFEGMDEKGEYCFDVATGEVEYYDVPEASYNYYEKVLGCNSLMEALDFSTLVWGENEDGETVAYYEG